MHINLPCQPRLRPVGGRRDLQRTRRERHRSREGGARLLPRHERVPGPFTDFRDHADALEQPCQDLVGASLTALGGGPSGEVLTPATREQVATCS